MLRGITPRLKGKIARRVEDEGTNMNDVLVSILAEVYQVEFVPTGVRRLRVGKSDQALLEVPEELKRLIAVEAANTGETIRNLVVRLISESFGEPFKATGRWVRKPRVRKTAAA